MGYEAYKNYILNFHMKKYVENIKKCEGTWKNMGKIWRNNVENMKEYEEIRYVENMNKYDINMKEYPLPPHYIDSGTRKNSKISPSIQALGFQKIPSLSSLYSLWLLGLGEIEPI